MPLQFEQPEEQVSLPQPLSAEQVAAPEPITQADPKQKRAQRLLRFLSPFNKVRRLAEPVLKADAAPAQSPPASLAPIQKSFSRSFAARWREKEVALAYLSKANLTDEQKKEAVSFLSMFLLKSTGKQVARILGFLFLLVSANYAVLLPLRHLLYSHLSWWASACDKILNELMQWIVLYLDIRTSDRVSMALFYYLVTPMVLFSPVVMAFVEWDARKLLRLQGETLATLGALGEVSAVPFVAESASKGHRHLRGKARASLLKLYRHLTPEHLGTFSAQTVPNLCNALSRGDSAFLLQTLHALELIGDIRAVPALKQLAEKHESVEVRETAQRLIYILEAREEGTVQRMSLLRASRAPKEASEHLLRPAHGRPETDVSELLRPSEGEGE